MGGKSQTVTQKSAPWKPVQPFLKGAMGTATDMFKAGKFAPDPFQGTRVAGFGGTTTAAHNALLGKIAGGSPGIDTAKSTLTAMMGGGGQYPGMQGVRDVILGGAIPAAASMFSGSGMTNSSVAQDGVGRAATEALAPFEYGAYENAQNRALQAAGMMPGMEQASYMPLQLQAQIGAQQDAMAQAKADAEMKKYYETQGQDAANFQPYLNAIMGLGGMGGQSSSTEPVPGTGLGPAIMGGLGTYGTLAGAGLGGGASIGGGILAALAGLSDRRAKEDITRIGTTDAGTPVYKYRYKGTDNWQIGVMADENPHAIKGYVNGFAVLDYGRVA